MSSKYQCSQYKNKKTKQNKNVTFLCGRRDKTRGIKDRILKFVPRWVVFSQREFIL